MRPGAIVRLGGVEGTFVLPDPLPARLLFISAGSGITPIMSMLRSLAASGELRGRRARALRAHAPTTVIFGARAARARTRATPATACTSGSPASRDA